MDLLRRLGLSALLIASVNWELRNVSVQAKPLAKPDEPEEDTLSQCTDMKHLLNRVVASCPDQNDIDTYLRRAGGTKMGFFKQMYENHPFLRAHRDSGIRVNTTAQVCFMGDSITRELQELWERIAPLGSSEFRSTACNILSEGKIARERRVWLSTTKCDAIFVGGLGPHCLRRFPGEMKNQPRDVLSLGEHKAHAEETFRVLSEIACTTSVPVVFVGSPIVEGEVLLLDPPKGDWAYFHDFALTKMWGFSEKELFERLYNSSGHRQCESSPLLMLDYADFQRKCPGSRCDGMHFNSANFGGCKSSPAIADYPFVNFLQDSGIINKWESKGLVRSSDSAVSLSLSAKPDPTFCGCRNGILKG